MADKTTAAATLPFKPTVTRKVTKSVLKMETDVTIYVRAGGKMYEGKEIKGGTGENAQMKPAVILDVTNLATGEEQQIVCGTVLAGILEDAYPNDTYIGKCYQITKRPKVGAKRYFNYELDEIADPAASKAK